MVRGRRGRTEGGGDEREKGRDGEDNEMWGGDEVRGKGRMRGREGWREGERVGGGGEGGGR